MLKRYVKEITFQVLLSAAKVLSTQKRKQQKIIQFRNELWVTCYIEKVNVHSMVALLLLCHIRKSFLISKVKKIVIGKNVRCNGSWPVNMVKESSYFRF